MLCVKIIKLYTTNAWINFLWFTIKLLWNWVVGSFVLCFENIPIHSSLCYSYINFFRSKGIEIFETFLFFKSLFLGKYKLFLENNICFQPTSLARNIFKAIMPSSHSEISFAKGSIEYQISKSQICTYKHHFSSINSYIQ